MTDCASPLGRVASWHERQIAARMARAWHAEVVMTGKGNPDDIAAVDAIFSREGVICAVAEIKWRAPSLTFSSLHRLNSYLITHRKLQRGRVAARLLRVPYLVVAGLADADVWWTVADLSGRWVENVHVAKTTTQRTINGGTVLRWNAYIPLTHMRALAHTS